MWHVKIHRLVIEEDFKKIDFSEQLYILRTIRKKLSLDPESYGKPLRGEFKGYWRLSVGDFRVIYRIIKNKILVLVIKIGIRRDARVYEELFFRLKKL
ncbi:MAG: type II toxin-antitoxin system RelE/ParE family toxin [Candidatus Omnitrophica bacterium]|nr:type II toxin-antitoxin system RelE/ParE family toxin [Candidatus Omnitrophota bacterium]